MKAIIICAGEATRWADYLGTKKHLIEIDNEKIVHRTARLLKKHGVSDISIVTKEYDERYDTPYSTQEVVKVDYETNADADKFLSSKHLWNKQGRTIVLYGDCYFTEDAIKKIVNYENEDWTLFCRPHPSEITGSRYGECFAQSFYPKDIERHENALKKIAQYHKEGVIRRCGGWEHYRAMVGTPLFEHKMTTNWELIDDFTDDFDYPEDYENWIMRKPKPLFSVSLMACKEREDRIPYLKMMLGNVPVSMDEGQYKNLWENCRNAWSMHNKDAKWHLVLQDDSIIPLDFIERLEAILTEINDDDYTLALYAGGNLEKEIIEAKSKGENKLVYQKIKNENALVMKTKYIDHMIGFCDRRNAINDRLIDQFCLYKSLQIYYPLPSIVQHSDDNISYYRLKYDKPEPHKERKAVWYCED
jgi:hypothetical protein